MQVGVTVDEELAQLRAENQRQVSELMAELAKGRGDPPPRVRANRPKREGPKPARKKRSSEHAEAYLPRLFEQLELAVEELASLVIRPRQLVVAVRMAIENVALVLQGKRPRFCLNPEVLG